MTGHTYEKPVRHNAWKLRRIKTVKEKLFLFHRTGRCERNRNELTINFKGEGYGSKC